MRTIRGFSALFFSLVFSVWLGKADQHTDDTGILLALIGLGGFLAAAVEPRRSWMWGVIVPAGIVGVELWHFFWGSPNPSTGGMGGLLAIAAITLGVGSVGAYLGSLAGERCWMERG